MIEILATIFGLIQGILVMLNKRSNWIFYSLQMLLLVLFSINVRLWGDVVTDSIYFIGGIVGFILWRHKGKDGLISTFSWNNRIKWGVITIIGIAATHTALKATDNPLPLLDSVTSVTSVIATWFMLRHKLEAWIVWLVNDLFYIVEYMMLPEKALYLISLYVAWTLLAIFSYLNWLRILRGRTAIVGR